ncbi:hypothetical protein QYS49_24990 [Marivirga salinae]|uniref:Uncharacterized protein n=1 Tax=Marivirga salinarum TaxID=3059078 RepID=A0AA49GDA3_9BACT|nr:hypothetical protein [Marivirga sp. BDSF4-3]WKK74888.1 hypothetical protein QYS49_24990 [Marivirga sp. BDSF4-3]
MILKKLYHQQISYFDELAEKMEVHWDDFLDKDLKFSYWLLYFQHSQYHLFFEPDYHFSRYRLKPLRNSFYSKDQFLIYGNGELIKDYMLYNILRKIINKRLRNEKNFY